MLTAMFSQATLLSPLPAPSQPSRLQHSANTQTHLWAAGTTYWPNLLRGIKHMFLKVRRCIRSTLNLQTGETDSDINVNSCNTVQVCGLTPALKESVLTTCSFFLCLQVRPQMVWCRFRPPLVQMSILHWTHPPASLYWETVEHPAKGNPIH